MAVATEQLVERIWARDPTVWTGSGEEKWLGWLDEPLRMRERIDDLFRFVDEVASPGVIDTFVLLGMGGSSLAPIVLKQSFGGEGLHVLDTTHPAAIRRRCTPWRASSCRAWTRRRTSGSTSSAALRRR